MDSPQRTAHYCQWISFAERLVRLSEASSHLAQQRECHFRLTVEEPPEVPGRREHATRRFKSDYSCRSGLFVDQRHLAEELSSTQFSEVPSSLPNLNRAVENEVESNTHVTFSLYHLVRVVSPLGGVIDQGL